MLLFLVLAAAAGLQVLIVGEHLFQLSRVTGEQGVGESSQYNRLLL